MRIPGERIKRTRLIQTDKYVVAVEVEMVIPDDDPGEPCYESETVQLLREVKEHAETGDIDWLAKRGKVYINVDAASRFRRRIVSQPRQTSGGSCSSRKLSRRHLPASQRTGT